VKKRTLATTARCDARDAAMALYLLHNQGIHISSMSDLFREGIAVLAELAVHKDLSPRIESTQDAVNYLRENQLVDLLEKDRPNRRTLVQTLAEEDRIEISGNPPPVDYDALAKVLKDHHKPENEGKVIPRGLLPEDVVDGD